MSLKTLETSIRLLPPLLPDQIRLSPLRRYINDMFYGNFTQEKIQGMIDELQNGDLITAAYAQKLKRIHYRFAYLVCKEIVITYEKINQLYNSQLIDRSTHGYLLHYLKHGKANVGTLLLILRRYGYEVNQLIMRRPRETIRELEDGIYSSQLIKKLESIKKYPPNRKYHVKAVVPAKTVFQLVPNDFLRQFLPKS